MTEEVDIYRRNGTKAMATVSWRSISRETKLGSDGAPGKQISPRMNMKTFQRDNFFFVTPL
jgi:hypothetical protein